MTSLPSTTKSRLKKIPQTGAIWEGDRRSLGFVSQVIDSELGDNEDCIMWVDGSEGSVRSMEMISADAGHEAVVRALLKAIESPHHPAKPARPSKIIIRDRQLQFFLRGALQDLDIKIEYAADLPLIDELFRGFEAMSNQRPQNLPDKYDQALAEVAASIWQDAIWEVMADSDILTVDLADSDLGTVYICVMGMMSAEYGILIYRSLESLKQFRSAAIAEKSSQALERAFLAQDCWFLNYEVTEDLTDWETRALDSVEPMFGSLHPLEGMRVSLDEVEAKIVYLTLDAIHRFSQSYRQQLAQEPIPNIEQTYDVALPKYLKNGKSCQVTVTTAPELTNELLLMDENSLLVESESDFGGEIHEDLIPEGSLVTMGQVAWSLLEKLKLQPKTHYQALDIKPVGKGLPTILVQTSRPKAMAIIETIKNSGGLKGICFNEGRDPFSEEGFDLGLLQTENQDLHLFAEYPHEMTHKQKAIAKWQETCQANSGHCGLIITMGITGASRGNPLPKHMLAVFEVRSLSQDDLGLGVLQLMPEFQ